MARMFAEKGGCVGCSFCTYVNRHEELIEEISNRLLGIVRELTPGSYSKITFPRHYNPVFSIYRGFIDDEGKYLPMYSSMDHDKCRALYVEEKGKSRAYRLIKITGSHATNQRAIVAFSDRKAPPTDQQYETLKQLMIDALGNLCFQFVYDPRHPS